MSEETGTGSEPVPRPGPGGVRPSAARHQRHARRHRRCVPRRPHRRRVDPDRRRARAGPGRGVPPHARHVRHRGHDHHDAHGRPGPRHDGERLHVRRRWRRRSWSSRSIAGRRCTSSCTRACGTASTCSPTISARCPITSPDACSKAIGNPPSSRSARPRSVDGALRIWWRASGARTGAATTRCSSAASSTRGTASVSRCCSMVGVRTHGVRHARCSPRCSAELLDPILASGEERTYQTG